MKGVDITLLIPYCYMRTYTWRPWACILHEKNQGNTGMYSVPLVLIYTYTRFIHRRHEFCNPVQLASDLHVSEKLPVQKHELL